MKTWMAFIAGIAVTVVTIVFVSSRIDSAGSASDEMAPTAALPPIPAENCLVPLPEKLDFAGEPVPLDDPEVRERLDRELLVNTFWHSSTFLIMKYAHRYVPQLKAVLSAHNMPEDFVYLAVAESGLRNVVSPAGATGFWQIMSSTGKEYGLEIYGEVDMRYDPEKSAVAAVGYLKQAKQRFGSWTAAAASYNMGMGGLSNKIEEQEVENYYDLYLNAETSRYIFRILAFKLILENPEDYGFCMEEEELYDMLPYRTVTVTSTISNLAIWAKQQGTNYKTLRYYNPWLRDDKLTVSEGNSYEIHLPEKED